MPVIFSKSSQLGLHPHIAGHMSVITSRCSLVDVTVVFPELAKDIAAMAPKRTAAAAIAANWTVFVNIASSYGKFLQMSY
jgi:hypothetical protein